MPVIEPRLVVELEEFSGARAASVVDEYIDAPELLEPLGEDSFVRAFLDKRGEGLHHLTFDVPDAKAKLTELKERGVRVVDEREFSPDSYEAFLSPRSSHGVLIQIGSGYPTLARSAEWFKDKDGK